MLHLRTSADAAPIAGAASRRAHMIRTVYDEAPATSGAPEVLLSAVEAVVALGIARIEEMLYLAATIEARGPPVTP